ncbi:hypothetical protein S820908_123 [Synechococcus phage S-CAM9]|uniref:Uncharacterized protein n=1 Tax=Synechococcus phage S-CAM9 TaxID=1883369 RepID=A0A1D8KPC7_9CAUD|nr:hypothetical protein S820908_123 [Synechococcus phage S-CAM9]
MVRSYLNFANQPAKTPNKFTNTSRTGPLGTRNIPRPGAGLPRQSPKPEFGPNKASAPTPNRPTGFTSNPSGTGTDAGNRAARAMRSKTPTAQRAAGDASRAVSMIKSISKGPAATAAALAADDIRNRGVADGTLKGKSSFETRGAITPGTRVNEIGAKGGGKPSSGDPSTFPTGKTTPTPSPRPRSVTTEKPAPKPKQTGPITTAQAGEVGGPKSAVSTYKDKSDTKGLSVGRYKTLAQHRAAVAAQNNKK